MRRFIIWFLGFEDSGYKSEVRAFREGKRMGLFMAAGFLFLNGSIDLIAGDWSEVYDHFALGITLILFILILRLIDRYKRESA